MRLAIIEFSPQALRELLQLPDGCEVVDVRSMIDRRGVLEVKVIGAGWETVETGVIRRTRCKIQEQEDGSRVIDWGFPASPPPSASRLTGFQNHVHRRPERVFLDG